jgi:hypothetical protein
LQREKKEEKKKGETERVNTERKEEAEKRKRGSYHKAEGRSRKLLRTLRDYLESILLCRIGVCKDSKRFLKSS